MAEKYPAPETYGGRPGGWLQSTFGHPDLKYQERRTINAPQEAAKMGGLAQALGRLQFGFNAPDIEPQRQAEYRNLRERIIPQLAQHYGAGAGGRGAFEQNLAGAQAGVQERLAGLQNQRQYELQKLRQEQLPRLFETGLTPSFEGHITEGNFNPAYPLREPAYQESAGTPLGEAARGVGRRVETGLEHAGKDIHNYLSQPPRTPAEVRAQRHPSLPGMTFGQKASAKLQNLPPAIQDIIRKAYQGAEQYTRPGAQHPPETPKQFEERRKIEEFSGKYRIPEHLRPYIEKKHIPMLESIARRRRGRKELEFIKSAGDIENLYNFWKKNPAKRDKFANFFRSMVGKGPRKV